MTAKEAMRMIVKDAGCPALDYAVHYAQAGLEMDAASEEFRVQCLYVENNISRWRAGSTSKFSKEEIQEAREVIKKAGRR